jgi:hypothetical protein
MATRGEGEELAKVRSEPGRLAWQLDLSRLEPRRLSEQAGELVETCFLQNGKELAGTAQVLHQCPTKLGVLNHGGVGPMPPRQIDDSSPQLRAFAKALNGDMRAATLLLKAPANENEARATLSDAHGPERCAVLSAHRMRGTAESSQRKRPFCDEKHRP